MILRHMLSGLIRCWFNQNIHSLFVRAELVEAPKAFDELRPNERDLNAAHNAHFQQPLPTNPPR